MDHWPRYHEYNTAYHLPFFTLLGAAFLLSVVFSVFSVVLLGERWLTWYGVVFVVGWLLLIALVACDPQSFTSFLID